MIGFAHVSSERTSARNIKQRIKQVNLRAYYHHYNMYPSIQRVESFEIGELSVLPHVVKKQLLYTMFNFSDWQPYYLHHPWVTAVHL